MTSTTIPDCSPKVVEFHRFGRVVLIKRELALLRRLKFMEPVARQDDDNSIRIDRESLDFCRETTLPEYPMMIHVGLEPAAVRLCERESYQVLRTGFRPPPLARDPNSNGFHSPRYADAVDFIAAHDSGLIRYPWGTVEPAEIIAEVARTWPALTISVIANKVRETQRVRDALRSLGVACTAANHRNRPVSGEVGRVVVTTPKASWADGVDFQNRDIVFVMDAITAWQRKAHPRIMEAHSGRLFGFIPLDAEHSPTEQDWIKALFGFASVTTPAPGCIERPVTVSWERIFGGEMHRRTDTTFKLKQAGIWHHGLRNRLVRAEARAANPVVRRDLCPVVVLTEGVDHARKLSKQMPHSRLIPDEYVRTTGMSPLHLADLQRGRNPLADHSEPFIVTASVFAKMDLSPVDTIVRADGGVGLPPIARHQLLAPPGAAPLLIVDFLDCHHPELFRQSQIRSRLYRSQEWFAPNADPVLARVEQFLAARPSTRRAAR